MAKKVPLIAPGDNPFCDQLGLKFTVVKEGLSKCRIKITGQLLNPQGVVHGGVIYTMADTGMGAALYPSMETEELCATVQLDIHYFKAVSSGTLHCTTRLVRKTRKLATLESEVRNKNSLIAKAIGTYYIFNV